MYLIMIICDISYHIAEMYVFVYFFITILCYRVLVCNPTPEDFNQSLKSIIPTVYQLDAFNKNITVQTMQYAY